MACVLCNYFYYYTLLVADPSYSLSEVDILKNIYMEIFLLQKLTANITLVDTSIRATMLRQASMLKPPDFKSPNKRYKEKKQDT